MYNPKPISSRKEGNVIILGAGASLGSSLKQKPPIVKNFIKKGEELNLTDKYSILWRFLAKWGYSFHNLLEGEVDIEEVYSMLSIFSSGLWHKNHNEMLNEIEGNTGFSFITPSDLLESLILEILNPCSMEALNKTCIYHDQLFRKLKKGDSIISFNYDLIADASLYKNQKWSEFTGYGFISSEINYDYFYKYKYLNTLYKGYNFKNNSIQNKLSDILLLKPHGSLNWIQEPTERESIKSLLNNNIHETKLPNYQEILLKLQANKLKKIIVNSFNNILRKGLAYMPPLPSEAKNIIDEMYENANLFGKASLEEDKIINYRDYGSFIIPPNIYKLTNFIYPKELIEIWSKIKLSLIFARRILIVGYSFRETDLHFKTLFNHSIFNNKTKDLKIGVINPDEGIVKKLRKKYSTVEIQHLGTSISKVVDIDLDLFINK